MADHARRRRNIARIFAPLALLACGAAVAVVVVTFTNEQADDDSPERTTTQAGERTTPGRDGQRRPVRRFYRVKLNDTLGLIAEKTGVPVERLQELNPELDPQNLIVGQRVKLRE
jgi:LysM repeat protein